MRIVSAWENVYMPREGDVAGHCKRVEYPRAALIEFGVDYERPEAGAGMFSTAIIELPDGAVKNVPVEQITFTNPAIKAK